LNTGRDELIRALNAVSEGAAYLQGEVVSSLIVEAAGDSPDMRLSPREHEVLQLVANGFENKQVAVELDISEATVKTYLRGIFERFGVSGRAEAVAVGLREGLIE
jgi:DNA-binding NarL/FixJ family response regulator